jgi:hypothetical protein
LYLRGFLDRPDVEAYIRNDDLVEVVKADILLARIDGLELDSGLVVECISEVEKKRYAVGPYHVFALQMRSMCV